VLLKRGNENKYESPYTGPYRILKLNKNGTVRLKVGAVTDAYNVRRLTPYTQPKPFNHGGLHLPPMIEGLEAGGLVNQLVSQHALG
jgi:hypothetical protein